MKENFGVNYHVLFILAPMEDVTDIVFRHVVSAARPDVFSLNLQTLRVIAIRKVFIASVED